MKNNARLLFQLLFTFLILFLTANAQISDKIDSKPFKIFEVIDFSGEGTYEVFPGDKWEFFGPTRQVTVDEKQKILGAGTAVFGTSSGTSRIAISLCYAKKGTEAPVSFAENNHLVAEAGSLRHTFSVSVSADLPIGKYAVGYCVNNRGPQTLNNNDYVNGWVILVK
jgi:hypothetical protein